MTVGELIGLVLDGGLPVALLVALVVVWRRMLAERAEARADLSQLAVKLDNLTERLLKIAERRSGGPPPNGGTT